VRRRAIFVPPKASVHVHGVPTSAACTFRMRSTTAPSASTSKSSSFPSPDDRLADARLRSSTVIRQDAEMSQLMESYILGVAESIAPRQPATGAFTDGRARMDIGSVIGATPLALGVLITLGGILVTMSYLSE